MNESLKISVTADIHDLTKQKYPIAQSGLGDRVFLIDERIGLDAEVRVVNRSVLRDWRGNILDVQLTFGNQDITKRYQSNLDHAAKTINDLIEGREKLPINAMAQEVANVTSMILGVTSELDITPQGLIAKDKNNPNYVVVLNSAGLGVSTDGGTTFRNAITGRGIVAERILAGEIKGSTLRTGRGSNYVHIEKQFIRLMESNLTRLYHGYYTNSVNQLQPTIVLGGDSSFQDGSVVLSQQPTQGFLGIINGKDSNGDPYFVSSVMFRRSGDLILKGGMNGSVTVNSGKGINNYANGGSYWVEATDGIGLKGGNKSVLIDSRTAIVFSLNDKNMLDVVDNNGETDLRFQTLLLRNGSVPGYAGKLQVKSGSGTSYSPVVASNFETSSQRKYKTNIRDVQFSALEKIMALNIQQYNLKTDMEQLYEMRMNRQEDETVLTTKDITTRYGWIADDENNPECFVTKERNAAEIYSSLSIQIRAFQEEKIAKDKEIDDLKTKIKAFEERLSLLEQRLS
ncbi:tail fiber domain-containing protein [Bacillus cereus]